MFTNTVIIIIILKKIIENENNPAVNSSIYLSLSGWFRPVYFQDNPPPLRFWDGPPTWPSRPEETDTRPPPAPSHPHPHQKALLGKEVEWKRGRRSGGAPGCGTALPAGCGLRAAGTAERALSLVLSTTSFKKRNQRMSKNQLVIKTAMVVVTFAMQKTQFKKKKIHGGRSYRKLLDKVNSQHSYLCCYNQLAVHTDVCTGS